MILINCCKSDNLFTIQVISNSHKEKSCILQQQKEEEEKKKEKEKREIHRDLSDFGQYVYRHQKQEGTP